MGVNNKKRRAAKQRKKARQAPRGGQGGPTRPPWGEPRPDWDAPGTYVRVHQEVTAEVRRLSLSAYDEHKVRHRVEALLRRVHPVPAYVVGAVLAGVLGDLAEAVVDGGWAPTDLEQFVRRTASERHLPTLAAALHQDARQQGRNSKTWLEAVDAVGAETRLRFASPDGLAFVLQVAACLASAPLLKASDVAGHATSAAPEHPKLAQVRALLAKAESTEFDAEAEALSAKAQELISRYALGQLLEQRGSTHRGSAPVARRLWLDAPYVRAKGALVHEVAGANRCRAAIAERFGFCLVVGSEADIHAVELLVTSLLVQANAAMLRHGRRYDARGVARTRSFRRSFLMAYATRIGDRLRATNDAVAAEDQRLLPVLRDQEQRVSDAFDAMVPHTTSRATTISNGAGWVAGLAAADLAVLDVHGRIESPAV